MHIMHLFLMTRCGHDFYRNFLFIEKCFSFWGEMDPPELTAALVEKAIIGEEGNIPVSEQYRIRCQEQLNILEEGGFLHLEELRLSEYRASDEEGKKDE